LPGFRILDREARRQFESGLALLNAGSFFDAHEALEDAWRGSPRGSPLRRHLQGLVQVAVAFHHQSRENLVGARSVLDRAVRNLNGAEDSFPDLDLDRLRIDLAEWQRHLAGTGHKTKRPGLPCVVRRDGAGRAPL
jgi:uncharacterized protein